MRQTEKGPVACTYEAPNSSAVQSECQIPIILGSRHSFKTEDVAERRSMSGATRYGVHHRAYLLVRGRPCVPQVVLRRGVPS